ncbi:MAG: hypothetical protein QM740_03500 [Acidovorax sp.]
MRKSLKFMALAVLTAALSACGGGGGSAGAVSAEYQITLRADNTQLPLNVGSQGPGIGAYAPYTTTLYVQATVNGAAIPGGTGIFGCNTSAGLSSGALYYLDGDTAHEDADGNPLAYRSITLDSNSGGNSFHFNAGNQTGTTTITCSVQDPRDKQMKSASTSITVGATSGKAASIQTTAKANGALGYLGVQGNTNNIPPSVAIQATVRDDNNQVIPNPSAPNLQIAIRQNLGGAATGARLASGVSGAAIQVRTNNGLGTFSLISGAQTGPIVLELTADRFDNNVANGIQDPIVSLYQVYAVQQVATSPLTIATTDLGTLPNGVPFAYALLANGGVPPFAWTVSNLPNGLTIDSSGVISGTPLATPGTYTVRLNATDANGTVATPVDVPLVLTGQPLTAANFTLGFCTGSNDGSTAAKACALPDADPGSNYTYAFSASVPVDTWTFTGLPSWLSSSTAGGSGVISGTPKATLPGTGGGSPTCGDTGRRSTFTVTASSGAMSVTRYVSIAVSGTYDSACQ